MHDRPQQHPFPSIITSWRCCTQLKGDNLCLKYRKQNVGYTAWMQKNKCKWEYTITVHHPLPEVVNFLTNALYCVQNTSKPNTSFVCQNQSNRHNSWRIADWYWPRHVLFPGSSILFNPRALPAIASPYQQGSYVTSASEVSLIQTGVQDKSVIFFWFHFLR